MAILKLVFRGTASESDNGIKCVEVIYNGRPVAGKFTRCNTYLACWVRWAMASQKGWGDTWMRTESWPGKQVEHTPKKYKKLPEPLRSLFPNGQPFLHINRFHESYVFLNNAVAMAEEIEVELNGRPADANGLEDIDRSLVPLKIRLFGNYRRFCEGDIVPAGLEGFPTKNESPVILRVHFRYFPEGKSGEKQKLAVTALEYRLDHWSHTFNVYTDTKRRTTLPRHRLSDYLGMVLLMKRGAVGKPYPTASGTPSELVKSVINAQPDWLEEHFGTVGTQPIQHDVDKRRMTLHPALAPSNIEAWYMGKRADADEEQTILSELGITVGGIYTITSPGSFGDVNIHRLMYSIARYILPKIKQEIEPDRPRQVLQELLSELRQITPLDERFENFVEFHRTQSSPSKTRHLTDPKLAKAIEVAAERLTRLIEPTLDGPRDPGDMKRLIMEKLLKVQPGSVTYTIELSSSVLSTEELDAVAAALGYERVEDWNARAQLSEPVELYPAEPNKDELRSFMAAQYEPYEPKTVGGRVREAAALLWEVIRMPRRGFKAPRMKYYFAPTLMAALPSMLRKQEDEPLARRVVNPAIINAFLLWPAMTFLAALLVTVVIAGVGNLTTDVSIAAASTLMGWLGSMICGPLFNVLGVGTGTIFVALCFASVQAMLVRWTGSIHLLAHTGSGADPFVVVVMGVIGTSTSVVNSAWQKLLLLAIPAAAITATAARMAEPRSDESRLPRSDLSIFIGAVLGILAGGAIGAIMGLVSFLRPYIPDDATRFCMVAAPIIGFVYGLAVWLRLEILPWKTRLVRSVFLAMTCAVVGCLLWFTSIHWLGTARGVLIGNAGTSLLHASVFTLSYVIGYRIGGRRAGAVAATVEGVGGFVIANSIQLGSGNILWVLLAAAGAIWELLVTWLAVCITQIPSAQMLNPPSARGQSEEFEVKSSSIAAVQRAGNLLPPIAFATAVAIIFAFHKFDTGRLIAARAVHYVGIGSLLLFLLASLYFQLESWSKLRRNESLQSLAGTYWKWYVITKLLPAPAAISILVGGLGLIYASPANGTFNSGWLLWLVGGFTFFFVDGLSFYLPEICYRFAAIRVAVLKRYTPEAYSLQYCSRRNEVMLLIHALSFPFVFALGAYKPQDLWRPVGLIEWLYHWFSNYGFTMTLLGGPIMLIVIVGVVILAIRGVPLYRRILSLRQLRIERIELNQ